MFCACNMGTYKVAIFSNKVEPVIRHNLDTIKGGYISSKDSLFILLNSSLSINCNLRFINSDEDKQYLYTVLNVKVSKIGNVETLDIIVDDPQYERTTKLNECIDECKLIINQLKFRPTHILSEDRTTYLPIDDTIKVVLPLFIPYDELIN